jgi:hypothetical protein
MDSNNYLKETIKLVRTLENGFLKLGERLGKIRDKRMWEESGYETFELYLEEAKITPATASRLITVYNTFVIGYEMDEEKLSGIGWSVLYLLAKDVKNKKDAEEFVEKAMIMKRSDIEEELRDRRVVCSKHDWEELYIRFCKKCNKKEKIYEER